MTMMLFAGTMLAAILGAVLGAGVGALIDGMLSSWFSRDQKGVDEGWSLTSVVRGALWGILPGLVLGGYFGFRWLVTTGHEFPFFTSLIGTIRER